MCNPRAGETEIQGSLGLTSQSAYLTSSRTSRHHFKVGRQHSWEWNLKLTTKLNTHTHVQIWVCVCMYVSMCVHIFSKSSKEGWPAIKNYKRHTVPSQWDGWVKVLAVQVQTPVFHLHHLHKGRRKSTPHSWSDLYTWIGLGIHRPILIQRHSYKEKF